MNNEDMNNDTNNDTNDKSSIKTKNNGKKHIFTIILILLPIVAIAGAVFFTVHRIRNWINPVTVDSEVTQEDLDNYQAECYDSMIPLLDENGYVIRQDIKKIVIFGNDPFATDSDNDAGMASMLANETGIEVINCAVEGSYLACSTDADTPEYAMDWFTPYYLSALFTLKDENVYKNMINAADEMNDDCPYGIYKTLDTLYNLDPGTVDAVVYMYDFADYWMNHKIYTQAAPYSPDTVCGNLTAAYKMIHLNYSGIRIITMSPYYNYYVTEDGSIESSEFHSGDYGTPSTYFFNITNMTVDSGDASFVDNLFGSITEDNYSEYLSDYNTLNSDGRSLIVSRLKDALFYY